jgi:hypothetical protein
MILSVWMLHLMITDCVPPYSGSWDTCLPKPLHYFETDGVRRHRDGV